MGVLCRMDMGCTTCMAMCGEWVEDCWHGDYKGAPTDGSDWLTGGDCGKRVLRGGSWYSRPRYLRSANRSSYSTGDRYSNVGFRIARTLTP